MTASPRRREVHRFLELVALCGIAFAQPLFDLLARNATLFIAWEASTLGFLGLTVIVVVGPPMALWGVGVAVGAGSPVRRDIAHRIALILVSTIIAIEWLKKTALAPWLVVASGIAVAPVVWFLLVRFQRAIGQWLRYLAIAPVLFAALFLGASSVTPLVGGGAASAQAIKIGAPSRVVMIVMDEFPLASLLDGAGRIDADLYPNFAALARDSTWYRNETTVAPHTEEAVPAILSGKYPERPDALPHSSQYPRNLFTLLGSSYEMNVHEAVTSLCPSDTCRRDASRTGVHPGFVGMLRDVASIWRDFATPSDAKSFSFTGIGVADPQALDTGAAFVKSLRPATRPRLDFLHLLLPHFPWHYAPTGQRYEALPLHTIGLERDGQVWTNEWAATMGRQRHLLQVGAADRYLGTVLDKLRAIGEYDKSLIVVTADHGVAFKGGLPFRGVSDTTYPDIMWTPLFVKAPGPPAGRVDDRPARSIDVLPTIAELLDAQIDWKFDGSSLLGPVPTDGPRRLLDWERSVVHPPKGSQYVEFDGPTGFAALLTRQAAVPGPNDFMRQFRVGPYASLVGRPVSDFTTGGGNDPGYEANLDQAAWYPKVNVFAQHIPWTDVHGFINAPIGTNMAVAVNGKIVGLYQPVLRGTGGRNEFWGVLPSVAFRLGANDVRVYVVTGASPAVRLTPVELVTGRR